MKPLNLKAHQDLFQRPLSHSEEQNRSQENVICYLRKANKKTIKMQTKSVVSLQELMAKIEEKTSLQKQNLVVFLNGKKYELNEESASSINIILNIKNNEIIHLHNKKCVNKERMTIYIELFNGKFKKLARREFGIYSKQKIRTFNQVIKEKYQELQNMDINLIQSGRKLHQDKTFEEEDIENQSTLTIMVNSGIQNLTQKKLENKEFAHEQELNQQYIGQRNVESFPPKLDKEQNVNDFDLILTQKKSFKKKDKGSIIYRISPKKNLGTGEIWESDSSQSEANKKQLLKALWKKKQSHEEKSPDLFLKKSAEKNDKDKFSVRERLQLKKQIQKLFQSQRLSSQSEVKNLQPPKIATDEFIDEIEEIEFCDNENEIKKDFKLPFNFPVDLRQSIGKNKDKGSLHELIPTRDFDLDEMEL